jgi:hypothetical protein
MSAWSCPHDLDGVCQRVRGAICDPGMRGCVLHGKVVMANKDEGVRPRKAPAAPKPAKPTLPAKSRRSLPF